MKVHYEKSGEEWEECMVLYMYYASHVHYNYAGSAC